jgi:tight adherence protein C
VTGTAMGAAWAALVVAMLAPRRAPARLHPKPSDRWRVITPAQLLGRLTAPRERRRRDAAVVVELPEVVDLLVLAVGSGRNVALAVEAVASRSPPRFAAALTAALERVGRGERLADALARVPHELGEPGRPLVAALVASERYGVPVLPTLERLALDARADRRRRAEEAARRVPVTLLFPLVLCVLPAFGLLTVAPLLAGTLGSLGL